MRRAYIPVAAMLLFMLAPTAHAVATSFCVGTSAELQAALDQSATDGVDDVIKIRSGTYAPTTGSIAFAYFNSSDDTSLTISGGWSNLGMFNCIAQFGAPTATVLSGANARRVMRLQGDAGTSGALSVSNLTIRSGNASTDGGGLTLGDVAGFTGNLRVEQVYFDSNFATTFAAGALIATGGTIIVRNNWFRANECDSNYCAGEFVANFADKVDVRNSIGNNTIVANACGPGAPVTCVNSGFIVSGSARVQRRRRPAPDRDHGPAQQQHQPAQRHTRVLERQPQPQQSAVRRPVRRRLPPAVRFAAAERRHRRLCHRRPRFRRQPAPQRLPVRHRRVREQRRAVPRRLRSRALRRRGSAPPISPVLALRTRRRACPCAVESCSRRSR